LDARAPELSLEQVGACHAVPGDVRWHEGSAAVFDAAVRHRIRSVFDGDGGPRAAPADLGRRATLVVSSEPGFALANGRSARGGVSSRLDAKTGRYRSQPALSNSAIT
jgi:hypothetical protein